MQNVPTAANIRHYAAIVRERSILRQLAGTAGEIAEAAYRPMGRSAREVLDLAEAKVLHIAEQGSRGQQNFAEIGRLLTGVVERIEELYNRDDPSDVTGVATGFTDLDRHDGGPAARRSHHRRRTTEHGQDRRWRSTSASTSRWSVKRPVAVFSMEMGATQLAMRLIGSVAACRAQHLRTGRLQPEDWEKLAAALGRLNDAQILIDETPALSAIEVRSRARRMSKQYSGARARHRRLPPADAGVVAAARTARPRSPRSRAR